MTRNQTIGKCKICGEQRELRFMNFCWKCYDKQMAIIKKEQKDKLKIRLENESAK